MRTCKNQVIRAKLKEKRIYNYQLADALGVSESTLCRMMRKEILGNRKKEILEIIERL